MRRVKNKFLTGSWCLKLLCSVAALSFRPKQTGNQLSQTFRLNFPAAKRSGLRTNEMFDRCRPITNNRPPLSSENEISASDGK